MTDFIAESREGFAGVENEVKQSLEDRLKFEIDAQELMADVKTSIDEFGDSSKEAVEEVIPEEELNISSNEINLYGVLNALGFALIGAGIWWFRKRKKSQQVSEETDLA